MSISQNFDDLNEDLIKQKILSFEDFIENVLKQDLAIVSKRYDDVNQRMTDYNNIVTTLNTIKDNDLKEIKTMNDLGANCYVKCRIPNTDRIFLDIGLKYYVELTTNEAIKFINIKNKLFQQELDILVQKAAKIKAHIKTLLNMIDQLR